MSGLHRATIFMTILKRKPLVRLFILITCTSFIFSYIWVRPEGVPAPPYSSEEIIQEVIKNVAKDPRYSEIYRKAEKLPKDLKYILLWTPRDYAPFYYFGEGQRAFIQNNCSVINCYVTTNKSFFKGDVTKFDVIAFNGRNVKVSNLPRRRAPHQKYLFVNMESSANYPLCSEKYDNFFNWTATYRLDSDIFLPYILIKNKTGHVVGPNIDMKWNTKYPTLEEEFTNRFINKSKPAAWFVSHCSSKSGRKALMKKLQKALDPYGHRIDVYGSCGPLKCPRDKSDYCDSLLESDYYFYLSLENSFAEDYVTEKLLKALQHDVVPIVYGGANYSRFLPPGSYLDAKKMSNEELAASIDRMMHAPILYSKHFRWKTHYSYVDPQAKENVCTLCAELNSKKAAKVKVYKNFRSWWNPLYKKQCK